jgi:hypothetical protein
MSPRYPVARPRPAAVVLVVLALALGTVGSALASDRTVLGELFSGSG